MVYGFTFFVITEPLAKTEPSPITTPGITVTFTPMNEWFSIITFLLTYGTKFSFINLLGAFICVIIIVPAAILTSSPIVILFGYAVSIIADGSIKQPLPILTPLSL